MIDFGAVSFEWGTMFIPFILFIPALLFYAFVIYFLVRVLTFMKIKNQHDEERNRKLDQLVYLLEKEARKNE